MSLTKLEAAKLIFYRKTWPKITDSASALKAALDFESLDRSQGDGSSMLLQDSNTLLNMAELLEKAEKEE